MRKKHSSFLLIIIENVKWRRRKKNPFVFLEMSHVRRRKNIPALKRRIFRGIQKWTENTAWPSVGLVIAENGEKRVLCEFSDGVNFPGNPVSWEEKSIPFLLPFWWSAVSRIYICDWRITRQNNLEAQNTWLGKDMALSFFVVEFVRVCYFAWKRIFFQDLFYKKK